MTRPGFIEAGLRAVRETLQAAADRAGLTLRHEPVTRRAAQRFRGAVRQLETVLRRLLVLMAARLTPMADRETRFPITQAKAGASLNKDAPSDAPVRNPGPRPFALTRPSCVDTDRLEALRAGYGHRRASPDSRWTVTVRLLDRYRTLLAHLDNPAPLARRMARHLAGLKRCGAPRPICPPAPVPLRYGHELGLVATRLPEAVGAALADFYDSG